MPSEEIAKFSKKVLTGNEVMILARAKSMSVLAYIGGKKTEVSIKTYHCN
jgi:hypothetical protein